MDHVDLNTATFEQLRALLGLTEPEFESLRAARPLSTPADAARALPPRLRGQVVSTTVAKRDINTATAREIAELAGVSAEAARAIQENGPYDLMSELDAVPGVRMALPRVAAIFSTPPRSYVDKLTKRRVELSPDPSRVVVVSEASSRSDAESDDAGRAVRRLGLTPVHRSASAGGMTVYALPETESSGNILSQLKRVFGGLVAPVFRDASGAERFLDPRYCVVQFERSTKPAEQQAILDEIGLAIEERFRTPGFYLLRVPEGTQAALFRKLEALCARGEVKFAEPNYRGFEDIESPAAARPVEGAAAQPGGAWNLEMIRLEEAWRFGKGSKDVIIAVLDSGVDAAHPALAGALVQRGGADDWDFTPEGADEPADTMGHGTFIAGLLVGNGALGVRGLCPGCLVLPLKVPLLGERDSYIRRREAILHAVDSLPPGKRLVMNLSWKTAGDVALIRDAIETAVAAGVVIVASAGNSPQRANQPHYPSDYQVVVSVAAVDAHRKRSWYSFYGDQVDISAPGGADIGGPEERLLSAAPGGGVVDGCGTSFAAPHVAGAAALLLSAFPSLSPAQVRQALESTASPLAEDGLGEGLLDVAAALAAAARLAGGRDAAPAGDGAGSLLEALNGGSPEELVRRHGLPAITARLIEARRPWRSVEGLRDLLGMTEEHLSRLQAAPAGPAPSSDAEWLDRGGAGAPLDSAPGGRFNPVLHGILPVLQWSSTEGFQQALSRGHDARLEQAFKAALDRFVAAGVGHRLAELSAALPPDARARLLAAPESARRLLGGKTTDLGFFLRAVIAERRRLGGAVGLEEGVWTALGDGWLPAGQTGPLPPPGERLAFREEAAFAAPRLSNGVVVDLVSPAARAGVPNVLSGDFTPFDQGEARALVDKLEASISAIDEACPAAARLIRRFVSVIVVRRDDGAPQSLANFSTNDQPGRITLVNAHTPHFTLPQLVDRIVHEAIHSFLYVIEATHGFTPDASVLDVVNRRSPWTGNMLGLHSFLHACLVWFGLWKFWEKALGARGVPEAAARAELSRARSGFADPALPELIDGVLPFISADARALFPALVRDVRAGLYG